MLCYDVWLYVILLYYIRTGPAAPPAPTSPSPCPRIARTRVVTARGSCFEVSIISDASQIRHIFTLPSALISMRLGRGTSRGRSARQDPFYVDAKTTDNKYTTQAKQTAITKRTPSTSTGRSRPTTPSSTGRSATRPRPGASRRASGA